MKRLRIRSLGRNVATPVALIPAWPAAAKLKF